MSSAAAPATCGVDMEVPLRYAKVSSGIELAVSGVKPARILTPGARDVGLHDVTDRSGAPRRKRRHHVAGLGLGEQQALLEHGGDVVAGFDLGDDQVAIRLADHDRRDVDDAPQFPFMTIGSPAML